MEESSPPQVPSSFDPAIFLHSESQDNTCHLPPDPPSFTNDLEALHLQRLEIARENREKGIVIQHRSWKLSDVFQSDDDIRPGTRLSFIRPDILTFLSNSIEVSACTRTRAFLSS